MNEFSKLLETIHVDRGKHLIKGKQYLKYTENTPKGIHEYYTNYDCLNRLCKKHDKQKVINSLLPFIKCRKLKNRELLKYIITIL